MNPYPVKRAEIVFGPKARRRTVELILVKRADTDYVWAKPRDLVMDGLLLSVIEALQKVTREDYGNLVKILKQPVSEIAVVRPRNLQ